MSRYFDQVKLLLEILPVVAEEKCFALKGGTALNFFVQDLPRLSVDIDLTYIPVEDRNTSLAGIDSSNKLSYIQKLMVNNADSIVKIEPNFTLRGTIFPVEKRELVKKVQERFGMFTAIQVINLNELYAGKVCAALDRQHPRDLFDVKLMFEKNYFTQDVKKVFVIYLISHNRPINEILNPNRQNIESIFHSEFSGMAELPITLDELIETREKLIKEIVNGISENEKSFLLSFKEGNPQWHLLNLSGAENLPGVKWKLHNIKKMSTKKHQEQLKKLKSVLGI